jgi:hypothetical protein
MQHEPTPHRCERPDAVEQALFSLLIGAQQRPWSTRELELEIGDPVAVADCLARLHGAGLVHRCSEFAWATRAALHAERIL